MSISVTGSDGSAVWGDATSKAQRVSLFDAAGNRINIPDQSVFNPGASALQILGGANYKSARALRVLTDGSLPEGRTLSLVDSLEGAVLNTALWTSTNTTMTVAQANGLLTFNSGNSVAATVGNLLLSQKQFPLLPRSRLVMRSRQRHTAHFTNNIMELGFGTNTSATVAGIGTGACWRKDGTGQYIPVISTVNGTEVLGTPVSNATIVAGVMATEFAIYEVELEAGRAFFRIISSLGVIINEQSLDLTAATGALQTTHVNAFVRAYNVGVVATAVQLVMADIAVWVSDFDTNMPWGHTKAAMSHGSVLSPTTYAQLANYANSAAPSGSVPSNIAAAFATLGGQFAMAATVGAETDLCLFGFQVPVPYQLVVTGVRISAYNMGAVVATTPTVVQFGLAESPAVTLATNSNRVALGSMYVPVGAVIGQSYDRDISWVPGTPFVVNPGRFLQVIIKVPLGTATASQLIRGCVTFDGYFI